MSCVSKIKGSDAVVAMARLLSMALSCGTGRANNSACEWTGVSYNNAPMTSGIYKSCVCTARLAATEKQRFG